MSSPSATLQTPAGGRSRVVEILVFGAWAALVVHASCYVAWFGSRMPIMDDLEMSPAFLPQSTFSTISDLFWHCLNEHRVYLSRWLHYLGVTLLGDFRAGGWMQVILLAIAALVGILTARRLRGRTRLEDALFPLLLLHWSNGENLLLGTQICVAVAVLLCVLALTMMVWSPGPPSATRIVGVGACTALMPLAGGFGLCPSPAYGGWLAWSAFSAFRSGRKRAAWASVAACLVYAGVLALYFHEYLWPPSPTNERRLDVGIGVTVQVLSMTFGGLAPYEPWYSIPAALVLVSVCIIGALQGLRAGPAERDRALGIGAALAGVVLLCASIGWSRQDAWPYAGWAPRYSIAPAALAFAACYAAVLRGPGLSARIVPGALFVLLLVALPMHIARGRWMAEVHALRLRPFSSAFEAGLSIDELARVYGTELYTGAEGFRRRLMELRAAELPPFDRPVQAAKGEVEPIEVLPRTIASAAPAMERRVGGISLHAVAAPGGLRVPLPSHARKATTHLSVLPLAYLPLRPAHELTLGVRYRVVQVRDGQPPVEVARGELHPVERKVDRGLRTLEIELESGGGHLDLFVESTSNERPGTDWLGWSTFVVR